jgi:hypothetical protein
MAQKANTGKRSTSTRRASGAWVRVPAPTEIGEIFELKVTLLDSNPAIWRRLEVSSALTLEDLHHLLQVAMGWQDCHMHHFHTKDARRFVARPPEDFWPPEDDEGEFADQFRLADLKRELLQKFAYEYDFGDGWMHSIELVNCRPQNGKHQPRCLEGKNACPPEDCGGVYGYYEMLQALKNPKHEMHDEYLEWLGDDFDPTAFDLEGVNKTLARMRFS